MTMEENNNIDTIEFDMTPIESKSTDAESINNNTNEDQHRTRSFERPRPRNHNGPQNNNNHQNYNGNQGQDNYRGNRFNKDPHHNHRKQNNYRTNNRITEDYVDDIIIPENFIETTTFPYPITKDVIQIKTLEGMSIDGLLEIGKLYEFQNTNRMLKQDITTSILKHAYYQNKLIYSEGVLEIGNDGNGFLRSPRENYAHCSYDALISSHQIRKFGLRYGDLITAYIGPRRGEKYFSILKLIKINEKSADDFHNKINFDNLTPLYPNRKLNLESNLESKDATSTRVIDLISPIGMGQRALIVAPPRTGKTVLMQNIAHAISQNHPDIHLIVLLVDERPEEVTDMQRTVKGEVVSSTFDQSSDRHVAVSKIVIERAKRLVEQGKDVVILLDSITRLARAYNNHVPSSGKILSGGVDSNALQKPKQFFGAARNTENGGSLTIIATALIETGSKMDEVIFEEFKGTGNCEIVLDRKIADRRIFPAIDVLKSGTRKEEEMVEATTLTKMWMLRRIISNMGGNGHEIIEFLSKKIKETKDNKEFFVKMNTISQ